MFRVRSVTWRSFADHVPRVEVVTLAMWASPMLHMALTITACCSQLFHNVLMTYELATKPCHVKLVSGAAR